MFGAGVDGPFSGEKARVYHDEIATLRLELEQIEECYRGLVQKLQENGNMSTCVVVFLCLVVLSPWFS